MPELTISNEEDLEEVRLALYGKLESVQGSTVELFKIEADLQKGHEVPPFAPGDPGLRAVKQMIRDMSAREARLRLLIEQVTATLYPEESEAKP